MGIPVDSLYNVVVLPVSAAGEQVQVSATRGDRSRRLVSDEMTVEDVRTLLMGMGATEMQVFELLRGNRMAWGGRDRRRLFFTEEQLMDAGLVEWAPVLEVEAVDKVGVETLVGDVISSKGV